MQKIVLLVFCFFALSTVGTLQAQNPKSPDVLYGELFKAVQLNRIFGDNKTFADATPKSEPAQIMKAYGEAKAKPGFDLKQFVEQHFTLPTANPMIELAKDQPLKAHLKELWQHLVRTDLPGNNGSLLRLPKSYIVPGGRFREIYYWDSYFTMLGLAVQKEDQIIENMVGNFAYLINTYGFIPNGSRSYYLGRSQPPFFVCMLDVLAEIKGPQIYTTYLSTLEKEYAFWMAGKAKLGQNSANGKVVRMPDGSLLNRYFDQLNSPRPESYYEDVMLAKEKNLYDAKLLNKNLRSAAESGWDFSSRWFDDAKSIATIRTTEIVPVDLNSILFHVEETLSKAYKLKKNAQKSTYYQNLANARKKAVIKYCYSNAQKCFYDYDLKNKRVHQRATLASMFPLFFNIADQTMADGTKTAVLSSLLKPGGMVTTDNTTGQQWDAPNGWAPLQWITIKGLMNYGHQTEAKDIALRWLALNDKVYSRTGKMMEKYNVENLSLDAGGGEYKTQDGFGWSNGVYLKLDALFR